MNLFTDNMMYGALVELMENGSIQVTEGYKVLTPYGEVVEAIMPFSTDKNVSTTNNGVVAFVFEGKFYATPRTRNTVEILEANGIKEGYSLAVPFSNGEIPYDEKDAVKWAILQSKRKDVRRMKFHVDCYQYSCEKLNLNPPLNERMLTVCYRVPDEGIEIVTKKGSTFALQVDDDDVVSDWLVGDFLGYYDVVAGAVAFPDLDGTLMVAPAEDWIIQTLEECGYQRKLDPLVEELAALLARDYAEKNYPKLPDGTFEPAWRGKNGESEFKNKAPEVVAEELGISVEDARSRMNDIANDPYEEFSPYWKAQNRGGAEFIVGLIYETSPLTIYNLDLRDPEVRSIYGNKIHNNWLDRNQWVFDPEYGDKVLAQSFDDLPEEEKQKDIDQMEITQRWMDSNPIMKEQMERELERLFLLALMEEQMDSFSE